MQVVGTHVHSDFGAAEMDRRERENSPATVGKALSSLQLTKK
jgi:hypothetical protein